jgi:hypothetical protein
MNDVTASNGSENDSAATWWDLVPEMRGPWDEPDWTCCGDPGCPFVAKCRDTERMDAAYEEFQRRRN